LAPDFNDFVRLQAGGSNEVNAVVCHLFDAAQTLGLVATIGSQG
jgi:hypothetical protein